MAVGAVAMLPLATRGQQKMMPVIGYLSPGSSGLGGPGATAFRRGLSEAGYVEGQNVVIEYRWAEGHLDRLPALALELASLKVDVLMVSGPPALDAAKRAGTIPIVDVTCDPIETFGISLARPGASATRLTWFQLSPRP